MRDWHIALFIFIAYNIIAHPIALKVLHILKKDVVGVIRRQERSFLNLQSMKSSKEAFRLQIFAIINVFSPTKATTYLTKHYSIPIQDQQELIRHTQKMQRLQIIALVLLLIAIVAITRVL